MNSDITWERVSADFISEGELRDIYVLGTTIADWQLVIDRLRDFNPKPKFLTDGELATLPRKVGDLLNLGESDATSTLQVPLGRTTLNCHFFTEEEIEFNLEPREMNASLLDPLLEFLELLGSTTGKRVILTMENSPENTIFEFDPAEGRVVWTDRLK